jgi:hypothetical protein
VTTATILLAAAMLKQYEIMVGVLEVAVRVVNGIAGADEGAVAVVTQVKVGARKANCKAGQELSRCICLNLASFIST